MVITQEQPTTVEGQAAPARAASGRPAGAPRPIEFRVSAGRLAAWLGSAAGFLAALHVWFQVCHYEIVNVPWVWRALFDLDEEQSFGTWFSSGLLLMAALALLLCGCRASHTDASSGRAWWVLSAGFLLLSIDEVACIHESFNSVTEYSWAIPGGILAILAGAAYVPFLRRLPPRTAAYFVIAGAIYLGGAVGVELATEGYATDLRLDTLEYKLMTALEELLEMGGIVVFLYALVGYLSREGSIGISVHVGESMARPSSHDQGLGA